MPERGGFSRVKLVRNDDMPPPPVTPSPYVELGVSSPFSFLRGASDAIELVLTALRAGYDAIGIADRNTLAGVVRMHSAAKEAGAPVNAAFLRRFYDRVVPGIYNEFDGPQMLPLIAPRPLLVINGEIDARTPLTGVQECAALARAAA